MSAKKNVFSKIHKKLGLGWILASLLVIVFVIVSFTFWYTRPIEEPIPDTDTIPDFITFGDRTIPVAKGVELNSYDADSFRFENGFMIYDSPDVKTFRGIDVSSHQDVIDWHAVKASGIDFAMIRAGFRGYTAGKINMDSRFIANINYAEAAGVDVGIYFFSQALTVDEAREEAEILLKWIRGYDVTYPVVFDWEHSPFDGSRTKDTAGDIITACAVEFCNTVYQAGYTPMVYFNQDLGYNYYGPEGLEAISAYDFWLAEYNAAPSFFYNFQILQYTSKGSVPGISGDVDLNICFVDYKAQN